VSEKLSGMKEITSFHGHPNRLLYVRELVSILSANSLLIVSSTTESVVDPRSPRY
jgi:hypothetical protein